MGLDEESEVIRAEGLKDESRFTRICCIIACYRWYKYYKMTFTATASKRVSFIYTSQNIFPLFYFIKCVVTDVYFLPLNDEYN